MNKEKVLEILKKYKSSFSKSEQSFVDEIIKNKSIYTDDHFELFTDGACEFNKEHEPINAGIGGIIKNNGKVLSSFSKNIGIKTNNEAEYLALIEGLHLCQKENIKSINIFLDSELVVKQVNGDYKVKNERMAVLHKDVVDILKKFREFNVAHVYRENNTEADNLSKEALLNKN